MTSTSEEEGYVVLVPGGVTSEDPRLTRQFTPKKKRGPSRAEYVERDVGI